jgi:caa(3)-type oxidase subunit IV
MAQGKKDGSTASQKKKDGGSEKKAKTQASEETAAEKSTASSGHDDHGDHEHKPNRKEYFYVFLVLFALTVLEVVVAQVPGISKTLLGLALVGLAVTKAAAVGLYYMHLKHETRIMRLTVAIPMATPAVYALVLIAEGAWRLAR